MLTFLFRFPFVLLCGNTVHSNRICKADLGFFVLIDDSFKCDNNYFVLKSKIGNLCTCTGIYLIFILNTSDRNSPYTR